MRSLKGGLLAAFGVAIIITAVSLLFVFGNTLRLQRIADERFKEERFYREIGGYLDVIQPALGDYLGSGSSSSLGQLLYNSESLKDLLPEERPIPTDERALLAREILFLVDEYLREANEIITQKRGRRAEEYARSYETLAALHAHIGDQIDEASLQGFRRQLQEYDRFLTTFGRVQLYGLLQIFIAAIFAYAVLLRSIDSVTGPLVRLSGEAERISGGDFTGPNLDFPRIRELDQVARAFNRMRQGVSDHVDDLKARQEMEQQIMEERLRNSQMGQLLKRMELYTLQAQMNPHFLFNTLNTGVQLAILENADRTASYMEKLADLLRSNIREKDSFVSLRTEIEGVRAYFEILRVRFPETLELRLEVPDSLLERFIVPAMIVQPLVENSVLHAFKRSGGRGQIAVFVGFDDPRLVISVRDNGSGIPDHIRRDLLVPHDHDFDHNTKAMGLENVIQRLFFYYPDTDDIVDIQSVDGGGTEVVIRIDTEVDPCIVS